MTAVTLTPADFLTARYDEREQMARTVSGWTVDGEPGNWLPAATGDEWEANLSRDGDLEVLVALRPGLPRPPDTTGGYWGAVVDLTDEDVPVSAQPMPIANFIAANDPARVLADVKADRGILALHSPNHPHAWPQCVLCSLPGTDENEGWPCDTVRLLVSKYATHPACRAEWLP